MNPLGLDCSPGVMGAQANLPVLPVAQISKLVRSNDDLIAQISTRVLQWITSALEQVTGTATKLTQKIAAPIVSGLQSVDTTTSQLSSSVSGWIQGQLASGPMAGAQLPAGSTYPGEYQYNLWSFAKGPSRGVTFIFPPGIDLTPYEGQDPCFRGSFANGLDAIAAIDKLPPLPEGACPQPGGFAPVPVGTFAPPPVPSPVPLPEPTPVPIPPEQAPTYMAGCGADGTPRIWIVGGSVPPLVTNVKGPFTDVNDAQAAAVAACGAPLPPGGPTPPGGTCDPRTDPTCVWQAMCCGANNPDTLGPGDTLPPGCQLLPGVYRSQAEAMTAAVTACRNVTPPTPTPSPPNCDQSCPVKLPDCIHIDLCDWKKFEDSLYNALCRWYTDCLCKLHNDTAYQIDDCDPKIREGVSTWMGGIGSVIMTSPNADAIAAQGQSLADIGDPSPITATDPWGSGGQP